VAKDYVYINGVPHRIAYDNLKATVRRVLEGRNRQEQESFIVFRSYYLFESRFCTPGQGNEKGLVEDGVGFSRRNGSTELAKVFLVPIPEVDSFEELCAHLWQPAWPMTSGEWTASR
jgi:transposase